jgi:hypothetical protein
MASLGFEIIDFFIEGINFKVRDNQDLAQIVSAWCQRSDNDPNQVIFQIKRTNQVFTSFDKGKRADSILKSGDKVTVV